MKTLFIACVIGGILLVFHSTYVSEKTHSIYTSRLRCLVVATVVNVFAYTAAVCVENIFASALCYAFFYLSLDWILLFTSDFVLLFVEKEHSGMPASVFRIMYVVFGIIDSISLILSVNLHHVFRILPGTGTGDTNGFVRQFTVLYDAHLVLCYLVALTIVWELLHAIFTHYKGFRRKYVYVLVAFVVLLAMDGAYMIFGFELNFFVLAYPLFIPVLCYLIFVVVPHEDIESVLHAVIDEINTGIAVIDLKGACRYCNEAARRLFDIDGEDYSEIEAYAAGLIEKSEADGEKETPEDTAHSLYHAREELAASGELHFTDVDLYRMYDRNGNWYAYAVKLEDVTGEVREEETQKYKATHDALTGLYNRESFFTEANHILLTRRDVEFNLVYTNIKDFKLLNMLFGEEFGNRIIKTQAKMLQAARYDNVVIGRMGGDRFAMLIPAADFRPDLAVANTKKIMETHNDSEYKVFIYLGVYRITDHDEPITEMCDKALMAIKSIYGNMDQTLVYFDQNMMKEEIRRQKIINEIDEAIENDLFEIRIQPSMTKESKVMAGKIHYIWKHSELGELWEDDYVPALERNGTISRLELLFWEKAIRVLRIWIDHGFTDRWVVVRFAPESLYEFDPCEKLEELAHKYRVPKDRITVEVMEDVLMFDSANRLGAIAQLRAAGFSVVIDQFGKAYSSLGMLKDMHITGIRVDVGMIREESERCRILVENIVRMADELHLFIIAGDVRDKKEFGILSHLGFNTFEGPYFGEAVSFREFSAKYDIREDAEDHTDGPKDPFREWDE